ncbi:MAG: GNAT family N-acetyltransferase [Desulfovibrionales bacterium]|nr:GNAT family N-acetyltransferase [Desulfovibrionales bacterium]
MLYSVEEIDQDHDLYEPTVAMRQTDLYPVGRVTRFYIQDELEEDSTFVVALRNRKLLGCGRLTMDGDKALFSHIVVGEKHRFNGVGEILLTNMLEASKKKGAKEISLESPPNTVAFFERFGFTAKGEEKPLGLLDLTAQKMVLTV